MGHVRQGRLPGTRRWKQVIELLGPSSPADVAAAASATNHAADLRLRSLSDDQSLGYCFWLLTRIAWASRGPDFGASVAEPGIEVEDDDSVFSFIARLSGHRRYELGPFTEDGPFSELAALSVRQALAEMVGQAGRSLFGSILDDLRAAFRRHSTPVHFAELAKNFFDLIRIASYVYAADQQLQRFTPKDVYGERWRRQITLCLPVVDPDSWSGIDVRRGDQ